MTDPQAQNPDAPWLPGGWLRGARTHPSPNCNPRPEGMAVDLIVVHAISLPPGQYGGTEVTDLFANRLDTDAHPYFRGLAGLRVSSHFLIRRNGDLLQFVGCDQRAWHAGASSHRGRSGCNDFSVGIELEGLAGHRFESPQMAVLAWLCGLLQARYPIAHIAGHEHIAPGRKADPGAGFDWADLQRRLGWPLACFPQAVGERLRPPTPSL